jgi:serine/threonine-protein kinase
MTAPATAEFIRIQSALAGRYFLERELGRGGMGIVFLARDVALDRLVAIKLLPPHLAAEPRLRERFLNEARTSAKLSHPNIVPIFADEEIHDLVFFVMAYVDGETLGARVRERGPMPPMESARVLREVAWGLAYAHAQGVIHRDVKADNILLERGSGRALIADFGIARATQVGQAGTGEILGTAEYMSPEQARGDAVDARSDIYSLGVVAFHALSARLPFEGQSVAEVLAKQIAQPAPLINAICPGTPRKLERAIGRCLAKVAAERFQTAEDLADVLGAFLDDRRDLPAPIRMFVKRSGDFGRTIIGVMTIQAVLAVFGLAFYNVDHVFSFTFAGIALVLGVFPAVGLVSLCRSLSKGGYNYAELIAAWNTAVEKERDERAFEHGRLPSRLERIARWSALGIPLGGVAMPFLGGHVVIQSVAIAAYVLGWIGGGVAFWRYDGRTDVGSRFMGRFWKTLMGRWTFALSKLGLRPPATVGTTHRPTELAIGMAVDALFDALPKATRERFPDLPQVVRGLENQASSMRRRVEELADASAQVMGTRPGHDADTLRADTERELAAARAAAQRRLVETMNALETIRLDLLRVTAGVGSVDGLTADLEAAQNVSDEVNRLLHGQRQVIAIVTDHRVLPSPRSGEFHSA